MRVTKKTKWRHVAPLLAGDAFEAAIKTAPERPLKVHILDLSCGDFIRLLKGDGKATAKVAGRCRRAAEMLGRLKALRRELEEVRRYMEANAYELEDMAERAAVGVEFPTPEQRILLTVQQRYFLHSMEEAERVPLADYLIAVREMTAAAKYEHNKNILMKRKSAKR